MRVFILILSCLSLYTSTAQSATNALEITHLTGDFYVYTTYQPINGEPFPSNSMYMLTTKGAILFDTPWDSTQFQPLLDSIYHKHHQKVIACFATHFHEDRTGGLAYYRKQGIATYTTKATDALSALKGKNRAEFLLPEDSIFQIGNHRFETYFAGAGHSPDNIVVWFSKEKILYGGCLIKSIEADNLGNLSDANPTAWANTIKRLQQKCTHPAYIIPGHQQFTSKQALAHTLQLIAAYTAQKNKE